MRLTTRSAQAIDVQGVQRTNAIVPLAGVEPDGDSLRWEVTGMDADDFMVMQVDDINDGKDRVELRFKEPARLRGPDRSDRWRRRYCCKKPVSGNGQGH